ncbi:MAG: chorismate mutase [Rhizobiaceae bacterium]|nr:chorismate mutase [Rhizobiaceae bacterium]
MSGNINQETLEQKLARLRKSIDNMDAAFIHIVAERFRITKQVGQFKAENKLPVADKGREKEQVERLRALAKQADLDPDFAEKLLNFIISEVIRHHEQARK